MFFDFEHDIGDVFTVGLVGDERCERLSEVAEKALKSVGYAEKTAAEKAALALKCCRQILWSFEGAVLDEESSELRSLLRDELYERPGREAPPRDPEPFAPPAAQREGEETVVRAWVREPVGMSPITPHKKIEVRVAEDGALTVRVARRLTGEL